MPDKSRSDASSGSDKPVYNDNPLFLRGHLEELYEWLPGENANHLNLSGGYFMVNNRKTVVMSAEHAAAIKDGTVATPTDFRTTFMTPIDPKRWKATSTALPAADTDRFSVQPEAIRTGLNDMLADICSTFEDSESSKDAKKEAGNCPITMLNMMKDEADNITNTMVGKIDDLMSSMMRDGLASPTLTGFSRFRKGYTALNLAMHDDERLSDAKLAKRFAKVVRTLGTVADTAMKFEMLKRSAEGSLVLTIKACKTVLGDMEADDKDGAIGAALTAGARRDPAIFPPRGGGGGGAPGVVGERRQGHPDRPFDASRDRPCFNCKTGPHWTADCKEARRDKADSAKARKAAKWKERKAKLAAAAAPATPAPATPTVGQGKSGRGSHTADTLTATPVLIQDAEALLAAAFSAQGSASVPMQGNDEAYECSSVSDESESEDDEEYDQADQVGQAKMGHGGHGATAPISTSKCTPTPAHREISHASDSDDSHHAHSTPLSWQQARSAVASLDSNPTMSAIRATIESTGLPVTPGTGDTARRTKVHIVAELRTLVGLSPLPAPVEMGIAVEESTPTAPPPPPPPLRCAI